MNIKKSYKNIKKSYKNIKKSYKNKYDNILYDF
jgi:hypothetical protein